jgi:hypothetical protein
MNKPLAFLCACISAFGLLVLVCSVYGMIVYGHGAFEAGNFTQYDYVVVGDGTRTYSEPPTGERHPALTMINTWLVGAAFVLLGVVLFSWDGAGTRTKGI